MKAHATLPSGGVIPGVPPELTGVLAWLTSELCTEFGTLDVHVAPVFYEERKFSHVLKVAVSGSGVPDRHLFVKIFKCAPDDVERIRGRVARDFERTRQIYQAMARWADLGAVRPVACSPQLLVSVTEEAPGETLLAYLQSRSAWLTDGGSPTEPAATMTRVGRWLRAFQSTAPVAGMMPVDSLRSYVDVRLERLVALPSAGFSADDRRRVLAYIDRLGAAADPEDLEEVTIHGDLAPANILVTQDRVTVLDFAMAGTGSRLHDLTRLIVQVELVGLKPQFRTAVLQRAIRALLSGFDSDVTAQRPMFRLLSLLHRTNHLATLASSRASFPASAYNWHVRRAHRAWIERELRMSERGV